MLMSLRARNASITAKCCNLHVTISNYLVSKSTRETDAQALCV